MLVFTLSGPPLILHVFQLHIPENHMRPLHPTICHEDMSTVLGSASWLATPFLVTPQSVALKEEMKCSSVCN